MVRIKYNEKSIVPEVTGPTKPLFKGISKIVLSALLLSHPSDAAQIGAGFTDRLESKSGDSKSVLRRKVLPLAPSTKYSAKGRWRMEAKAERKITSSRELSAETVSARSARGESHPDFDAAVAAGALVPVLKIPAKKRRLSVGETDGTLSEVSSVTAEVGSPPIDSPVVSPLGFRLDLEAALKARDQEGAASGAGEDPKTIIKHRRARRMSATAVLASTTLGRPVSGGVRTTEDDKARAMIFDGGGYRGLLSAATVWNIQKTFDINLPGSADLMAGTSAGGLNALGYATGMTPKDVVEFYRGHGKDIFSRTTWRAMTSLSGMARAKYGRDGIDALLVTQFKDLRLADLRQQVTIPALDITLGRPVTYSTREARENPHKNFKIRDVAAATSAAPSYFGVAGFEGPDGGSKYMADGGLFANNPVMAATSDLSLLGYDPRKAIVLSLGTGEVSLSRDGASMTDAGALKWGPGDMINLIMAANQKFAHNTAQGIYGENYARLQVELDEAHAAMDDTSAGQTDYLMSLAARMVDEKHDRLEQIVRLWDGEAVPVDMDAMD